MAAKKRPTFNIGAATPPAVSTGWVYRSDVPAPAPASVSPTRVLPAVVAAEPVPAATIARPMRPARVASSTVEALLLPFALIAVSIERCRKK